MRHPLCGCSPAARTAHHDRRHLASASRHIMIFELAQDFHDVAAAMPRDHPKHRILGLLEEALRRDIHFIARHAEDYPHALFQCMWNTCWWYDCPEVAQHYEAPNGPWKELGPKLCDLL